MRGRVLLGKCTGCLSGYRPCTGGVLPPRLVSVGARLR